MTEPSDVASVPMPPEYFRWRVSFWQRPWVARSLPWAMAIFLHAAFLIVAAILVPPLVRAARAPSQEQVVIPDTSLAEDGHLGGIPNPGLNNDPSRAANQETDVNAEDSKGWAERKSQNLAQALSAPAAQSSDVIASGANQEPGTGKDNSALSHLGGEGGGEVANFGPRGGGGGFGPKSRIFGSGSNVRSVVYVCDGTGSILSGKDDILKRELKSAVANLSPIQVFNVLIFQNLDNGAQFTAGAAALQNASPNNKTKTFDFLDRIEFRFGANPLPALEEAFREKPQLIFLLTDGEFTNPDCVDVMHRIDQINGDRKIRVNTVLLLQSRTTETVNERFEQVMNQIAQDNGGTYKKFYVDEW
ncbi:MAG: hypothetical protein ABSG31_16095 [Tepidisphaeraceae bacterium]|jgi:hypothetical protein